MNFPMQEWKKRDCEARARARGANACDGSGVCNNEGTCDCEAGYFGPDCRLASGGQGYLPDSAKYLVWAIAILGIAFGCFCIAWSFVKRRSKVLKAAQPTFLYVISLGCIFSIAAIFPASLDHRYLQDTVPLKSTSPRLNGACNAQVWVYALGFTLTFGALLTKLWRVMRIVNNTSVSLVRFSERKLWSIALSPMAVQLAILIAWVAVAPLEWKVFNDNAQADKIDEGIIEQHGECVIDPDNETAGYVFLFLSIGMQLLLLVVGNVLCFLSRRIPVQYAETKYIAFALASHLQTKLFGLLAATFIYRVTA